MVDDVKLENITSRDAIEDYSYELDTYTQVTKLEFNFDKSAKALRLFKLQYLVDRLRGDLE
jgi:hypothetical protein